jgi:hypothetical protein
MKIIWVTYALLIAIILAGVIFYQQQQTPDQIDKSALVELTLNTRIRESLQNNEKFPGNTLILLSTPNLKGIKIPPSLQGLSLKTLTQNEIDELSMAKSLSYWTFDKISETDPNTAEVDLSYVWNYENGVIAPFGESGSFFSCAKQSEVWVIVSEGVWIP